MPKNCASLAGPVWAWTTSIWMQPHAKGIAVMNTPGANAVAVAEQTLGMMLAMARHLCRADALMHAGKWEKKSLQGTELRGKTLGIVGTRSHWHGSSAAGTRLRNGDRGA